ncbi:MAG TPA: MBL fold metallo-hydrolase [Terriglobales bacterium]|nr:MBL fold metallo-hydrolase [Terriglobales bacterium]
MPRVWITVIFLATAFSAAFPQQTGRPEANAEPLPPHWCRNLPRPGYNKLERVEVASQWFEVYRIRPGVFSIYEPHQYEEVISYLILGSKRALLLDTGLGIGDMRAVVRKLTLLPVSVLNSHTHYDHIGDNWQFDEILGLDNDYSRRNAAGAKHDELRDAVINERFCGNLPEGFKPENYSIPEFKVTRHVKDGEVIDLGERQLQVLATPGHTPDSLCLLDKGNRLLFSGDTFYAGPIFLYVPETNVADYAKSVARLAAMASQVDLVLPSHNFPAESPMELSRLSLALKEVQSGKAKFTRKDGRREYNFGRFSLLMAD